MSRKKEFGILLPSFLDQNPGAYYVPISCTAFLLSLLSGQQASNTHMSRQKTYAMCINLLRACLLF